MTRTKKVQSILSLEREQREQLEKLHKATRIPRQVLLREGVDMLLAKYRRKDWCVAFLLNSYTEAVNDPDNELVHLYEIRDAIAKKFGGGSAAVKALKITESQWSRLGQLANDEPLKQGRHRGKNLGVLRDATEWELKEGRDIARNLVEAYLYYL